MKFDLIHPRDQIVMLMKRVYKYGMTTTSGGNISFRDENGDIWITPAGVDKGSLEWDDIVRVKADGTSKGRHRPSSEFPFHKAIYDARPDLNGIVHGHPSALVSFSLVGKAPPTTILPHANDACGEVGFAPYALPGSEKLGKNIAEIFKSNVDSVLLENHGIVCGGPSLLNAFHRFETLDFCARLVLKATQLGTYRTLNKEQLSLFTHTKNYLPEFDPGTHSSKEKALRRHICEIVHRAYDQHLMNSTEGVVSVRLERNTFLITPVSMDRRLVDIEDIVLVKDRQREKGKVPSRSVLLHDRIYRDHPEIQSIIIAQPPNAMAFAVTDVPFETRSIPESYILLQDVEKIPYEVVFNEEGKVSGTIDKDHPVLLLENDAVIATGSSLLQAFDRMEVAEFSARSLINAHLLGGLISIGDDQITEIRKAFLGE